MNNSTNALSKHTHTKKYMLILKEILTLLNSLRNLDLPVLSMKNQQLEAEAGLEGSQAHHLGDSSYLHRLLGGTNLHIRTMMSLFLHLSEVALVD